MLSDAAHSGIDLLGAGLTFFSVRISGKPADEDHTYGHGKIENLSAFVETGLMVISCIWITYEAIERIFFHPTEIKLSLWPFAVLLTSIAVDYWRSRQLLIVARRHGSAALEADALHFASDIWATLAVLLGLTATWIGERYQLLAALRRSRRRHRRLNPHRSASAGSSPARPSRSSSTPPPSKPASG